MRHKGLRILLARIATTIPILFGVVVVTFALIRSLPGDPAVYYASGPGAGPAEIEAVRRQLGLDRSLVEQFWRYLVELGSGRFGNSLQTGQPVLADFAQRLPATLELAILAFAMGVGTAIPLGILAAVKRDGWIDQLCRVLSSTAAAMPGFFFGLILIYFFYFLAGVAPEPIGRLPGWALPPPVVTGFMTIDCLLAGDVELFWAALGKMILPAASMAIFAIAPLLRMMRGGMIDALDSDYVTASRAFGLSRTRVLLGYALPNALLPVLATMGMVLSTMIGANIMIEKLFAWPGIGAYAINALIGLDYAPVQAFVLIVAVLFVLMTLAIDLISSAVDPRYGQG
ncbi:ABC transporter permease [Chelatococcus reniformis]|uniref:ABC transporter permease n=1 Tax=Chelatococcus reniformis TaxID=1494448 RepID=A0A916TZX8_9HYPH|nr:ABC transporter permease [Chelatococcus reniformis]GGC53606.1 ABC transporter permease [Chelatococcus reniformis]